jgi:hypothetical protein
MLIYSQDSLKSAKYGTLSSTCPRYKISISSCRSEEATGTPACTTLPHPLTRVKHVSGNPYLTCLILPYESTSLKARQSKTHQASTSCQSCGCTALHLQLQAFCMDQRCHLMKNLVVNWSTAKVSAWMAVRLPSLCTLLLVRCIHCSLMALP